MRIPWLRVDLAAVLLGLVDKVELTVTYCSSSDGKEECSYYSCLGTWLLPKEDPSQRRCLICQYLSTPLEGGSC